VSTAPLLDTHAWLWWIRRDSRLGDRALDELDSLPSHDRPYLSDISLWEVAMLTARRRLDLTIPLDQWLEAASHPRSVRVMAISAAVAAETGGAALSVLRDPADRIIVATSRTMGAPILTYDRTILRSRLARFWTPS
jgi:PIN domain nuclease of toxin-antitoxin system